MCWVRTNDGEMSAGDRPRMDRTVVKTLMMSPNLTKLPKLEHLMHSKFSSATFASGLGPPGYAGYADIPDSWLKCLGVHQGFGVAVTRCGSSTGRERHVRGRNGTDGAVEASL